MSRWLDIARKAEANSKSVPDTLQEPAKSPPKVVPPPFLQVSTGCRDVNEKKNPSRPISPHLPQNPPTCAACGKADWRVSVTDMGGRNLHVECWRAERKQEFGK